MFLLAPGGPGFPEGAVVSVWGWWARWTRQAEGFVWARGAQGRAEEQEAVRRGGLKCDQSCEESSRGEIERLEGLAAKSRAKAVRAEGWWLESWVIGCRASQG